MKIQKRYLSDRLHVNLARGKSILLLGARQTGKSTLIKTLQYDLLINFARPATRLDFEKNVMLLEQTIAALPHSKQLPLVLIDEVQKVPAIMDLIQYLIDEGKAQFVLTGSSARKLKNLLPGRVVTLFLSPLTLDEMAIAKPQLEDLLIYGSLPGIISEDSANRETDLVSYTETYLEEEIRAEALVRNLGHFHRFLYLSAIESGNILNFSKISADIGVTHNSINAYYQILEDCLIVERVEPITQSQHRKQLIKSPKVLWFDLGLRRVAANEGIRLPLQYMSKLFEQFVGLELLRRGRIENPRMTLHYWRDANGPEVDWVIRHYGHYIPFEVKWTRSPKAKDIRHLLLFCAEYNVKTAYVICQCQHRLKLADNILAMPWQNLDELLKEILQSDTYFD